MDKYLAGMLSMNVIQNWNHKVYKREQMDLFRQLYILCTIERSWINLFNLEAPIVIYNFDQSRSSIWYQFRPITWLHMISISTNHEAPYDINFDQSRSSIWYQFRPITKLRMISISTNHEAPYDINFDQSRSSIWNQIWQYAPLRNWSLWTSCNINMGI